MHAMVINTARHALESAQLPDPTAGAGEVLVRVHAAGLAYADLGARSGTFGAPAAADAPPRIAGSEFAGEIVRTGEGVDRWHVGDRVMGRGPGYAEMVTARADQLLAVPQSFTWAEAGGAAVALMTAHDATMTHGRLKAGDVVVVQGATSSVGIASVRLAATFGARAIFATGRSTERLETVRSLVHRSTPVIPVNLASDDLVAVMRAHGAPDGANLVVDMIGGSVFPENVDALAVQGRLVQVGRVGGRTAEIDLDEIARKRLTIVGVTFRTRSAAEVAELVHKCAVDVEPIIDDFRPPIHETYRLDEANAAQDALARGGFVGKLILTP